MTRRTFIEQKLTELRPLIPPPAPCAPCRDCERIAYHYDHGLGWICTPCRDVRELRAEVGALRAVASLAFIVSAATACWGLIGVALKMVCR